MHTLTEQRENHTDIRAVFLDIDGTLFSHSTFTIPGSALEAVREVRKQGIPVFACTGRHTLEMEELPLDEIELDGLVTLNGALCLNDQEVWYSRPLDPEDVAEFCAVLKENPFACIFLEKDRMYVNEISETMRKGQEDIMTSVPREADITGAENRDIYMLVPYTDDAAWEKISRRLKHVKAARWSEALDVFHTDTGKARGIEETCRRFNIRKEDVLAVGDGPNDVEMREAAGHLAAMGNAVQELKDAAEYVSTDIDEDGLARVFRHYGLIKGEKE